MSAPTDRERPLTDHGLSQAAALGDDMRRREFVPDFIFCSPSKRTQQTLDKLLFEGTPCEHPDRMYNAPAGDLLNFIQNTNDDIQNLMVIAHNPGIHQLAHMLSKEEISDAYSRLLQGYPPASLSVLECTNESWADIQPAHNKLAELLN